MQRIAEFFKVSKKQFERDIVSSCLDISEQDSNVLYDSVALPFRATKGSAGYEIMSPCSFSLKPGATIKIPTGIRVKIQEGWVFFIFPKSGLGFQYRLQLDNTVGVIDADYYEAENEGHILVQITNDSKADRTVNIAAGKAFAQGIFVPFGISSDDKADAIRVGGFGSTGV